MWSVNKRSQLTLSKIKAVTEWPQPTTVTEVRSFLGFDSYYRRCIPNFSKVAKPLNQVITKLRRGLPVKRKNSRFIGDLNNKKSLRPCKDFVQSPQCLLMQTSKPLLFSTQMLVEKGLVLYCTRYRKVKQRVIAYASRSLSKGERNYPVHKLEFLALKWAITDKFHEYLYGSQFQVYTDNNLLTYVLTTAKLDATGHRWVAALSNYTFSIIYKPGKGHKDADALSHIRWPEAMELDSQTVHAVCEGVQSPHGKVETLCQGAHVVDVPI